MSDVAGLDSDAQPPSCTGPPAAGALSAPEAIVTAEPNLDGLTLSNEGPVWLENTEQPSIWLASNPPRLLFDAAASPLSPLSTGKAVNFAAGGKWYLLSVMDYPGPNETDVVNITSSTALKVAQSYIPLIVAMDESRVYATVVFGTDISCFPITPGSCGPTDHANSIDAIAVDQTRLYALVLGPNYSTDGSYTVQAKTKGSGAGLATIGSGSVVLPAVPESTGFRLAAAAGNVAWTYVEPYGGPLDTAIYGIVRGGTPHVVVNDSEGVGSSEALPSDAVGLRDVIALDADYVYWVTPTSKVKRRRLCGGPIEVLATNQQNPIALAVNDQGVYWISLGSNLAHPIGNIMRMRKLGAPGSDAGTDASMDAGALDASTEGSESAPDASSQPTDASE